MNSELLKSVFRSVLQLLGVLFVLGLQFPILDQINLAIEYILGNYDALEAAAKIIIGAVIYLYGLFFDKSRFDARSIGQEVIARAKASGIAPRSYIDSTLK